MAGEMEIIKEAFEKAASIPAEGPKWGTTPETDLPGEARPEGLDDTQPVGDDAQNTRHLQANFENATKVESEIKADLGGKFTHFGDRNRVSHTQLIKNQPKTNAGVYSAASKVLKSLI